MIKPSVYGIVLRGTASPFSLVILIMSCPLNSIPKTIWSSLPPWIKQCACGISLVSVKAPPTLAQGTSRHLIHSLQSNTFLKDTTVVLTTPCSTPLFHCSFHVQMIG